MAELIERSPLAGQAPLVTPAGSLSEDLLGPMVALQPFVGTSAALSKALKKAHGVPFPGPGESHRSKDATVIWSGREQAFLLGVRPDPALSNLAAISDQSDGWCALRLEGQKADQALARLCPLDLRPGVFQAGQVARSQLLHVPALIQRTADGFRLLVFRSMARTAWHDIETALKALSAREEAGC